MVKYLKSVKAFMGVSAGLKSYRMEEVPEGQEPKPIPNRKGRRALAALERKQAKRGSTEAQND